MNQSLQNKIEELTKWMNFQESTFSNPQRIIMMTLGRFSQEDVGKMMLELASWAVDEVTPKEREVGEPYHLEKHWGNFGYNTCIQEILDKKRDLGL